MGNILQIKDIRPSCVHTRSFWDLKKSCLFSPVVRCPLFFINVGVVASHPNWQLQILRPRRNTAGNTKQSLEHEGRMKI